MKYQVGDEIIVLHSHEEGKVVDIMNDNMVMIEVRGVKFPAYMDQIDFPYFHRFTKKKIVEEKKKEKIFIDHVPKEKPKPNYAKQEDGVWLSFVPKFVLDEFNDDVVDTLKIYLINKTKDAFKFIYIQKTEGNEQFALQNEVTAFHDFYLHDIDFAAVNDQLSFSIKFSLVKQNKQKAEHFETSLKLKPKQVFKKIEEMKEKNEPTISYKLFDEYPDRVFEENKFELGKLASLGFKVYNNNHVKNHLQQRTVVDLHIDKITNDYKHLNNAAIIQLQLKEFEKWYHNAVEHHQPSLIIIHGIGKGKLKEEIHEILKAKKEVKSFINQYHPKFGYGATEIFFK